MKIKDLINEWNKKLKENKIEESLLKTKLILADELNVSKEYLFINSEEEVTKIIQDNFNKKMKRILKKEPFQYVLGYQEFMKMKFYVEKRCIDSKTRYRNTCGRSIKSS